MNTLYCFLLGLPIFIGVAVRFKRFDKKRLYKALGIVMVVYLSVAIGFSYENWARLDSILSEKWADWEPHLPSSAPLAITAIGVLVYGFFFTLHFSHHSAADPEGCLSAIVLGCAAVIVTEAAVALVLLTAQPEHAGFDAAGGSLFSKLLAAAFIFALLMFLGFVNVATGPVLAGFTMSATVHALWNGGGVFDIFFWRSILEWFDISTFWLPLTVLVVTTLMSVSEPVIPLLEEYTRA